MIDQKTSGPPRKADPTRRQFLRSGALGLGGLTLAGVLGHPPSARAQAAQKGLIKTRLAAWQTPLDDKRVECTLCPKACRVAEGDRGVCRVRENRDGRLHSLVFGNPCAIHLDPVERNPFFHVLPGSTSLALATAGCNFQCKFCQTWEISQAAPEEVFGFDMPAGRVVQRADDMGARSMAYTFVEPVIFYEYMLETGAAAREAGLLNLVHSNGYINPEPLAELGGVLDAANIDLKSFSNDFYQDLCGGELKPVLDTLKVLKNRKVHLEITNLVVPTRNDDMAQIRDMCLWIKTELGPDTPLHFWRFYPLYKLRNLPPTPFVTLENARRTAMDAGLRYVYIGNAPGHAGENTWCPGCRKVIIRRTGFMVTEVQMENGRCRYCGRPIPGIWDA